MPYITVEGGKLTPEQKEKLIKELTDVASKVMNVPNEICWTTIKELSDENIGLDGKIIDKIKVDYKR